jgi:hypothetical protein
VPAPPSGPPPGFAGDDEQATAATHDETSIERRRFMNI